MDSTQDHEAETLLTIVIPAYNSQDYLHRCIDSMLPLPPGVEIIVVNDGSKDDTPAIAQRYAAASGGAISVINKPNGGHGSAINAGLAQARGLFFKVCDSDDWFDQSAYQSYIETLRTHRDDPPDLVISNYVYEKEGKRKKKVIRYRSILTEGYVHTWSDISRFSRTQYLLMHALTYRTQVLRDAGLRLPEHTFYVDNLFAFVPLPHVKTLCYADVDLYRYYIGRPDQSVNEAVMIKRLDQQLKVNRLMIEAMPPESVRLPKRCRWYMEHYLGIMMVVSSVLAIRANDIERLAQKKALWKQLKTTNRHAWVHIRHKSVLGSLVNLRGKLGRSLVVRAYLIAQRVVGFN